MRKENYSKVKGQYQKTKEYRQRLTKYAQSAPNYAYNIQITCKIIHNCACISYMDNSTMPIFKIGHNIIEIPLN